MEKNNNDIKYWLWLGKNPKIGRSSFAQILSKNVDLKDIYSAKREELSSIGLSEKIINEIEFCQKNIDPDDVFEELKKRDIKFTRIIDDDYPVLLKEIYDPPQIIYYKGKLEKYSTNIAIVGSRKPTAYGQEATNMIAKDLAESDITLVSGMAIGIDTIAHLSAIEAKGKTIAVLGCGLDQVYPASNVQLAKKIIENGAIISEFPIGVSPQKYNFPLRNRIISGLSLGTVITEANEKSGSLITATSALEQNREVFAVPGSIFNLSSKGPNKLIQLGAKLVTSAQEILDELGLDQKDEIKKHKTPESKEEEIIFDILQKEPKHIDLIIRESKMDESKISTLLTMMEIADKVKHIGGMIYKLL